MASSTEIAKHYFDAVWPGHANPVTGDVVTPLEHAASGPA